MVDPRIKWPIWAFDKLDPGCEILAENVRELCGYVEYWNCPETMPGSETWEVIDANGRQLDGVIEHLDLKRLSFKEELHNGDISGQ